MSVRTPILTTSSEIWACAVPAHNTIATPDSNETAMDFIGYAP